MIRIVAIGKKHEDWIVGGVHRYSERLRGPWNIEWVLLPHSAREGVEAREEESKTLLSRLSDTDFVVILDERGKNYDSPALSQMFEAALSTGRQVVVIIGGAYGINNDLMERADVFWSLSNLVFPHQLVRLILTEQLYRAQSIAANHPYHHS